ncbi:tripartite tricarboxylate transporter substrate binding protein [Alcaligenaceae bacterium]|nr:tripartite tricarboxylate transporter substrate binding protein [Alcaligenaceae bacterium]
MKRHFSRLLVGTAVAGFVALSTPVTAFSADWPSGPIRMVVPYPPGGASDFSGRVYADQLSKELGQPVVVENKAGAAGEIGAQFVANATPDGYTVLLAAMGSLAINSLLPSKKQQYEFPGAFSGVSMATSTPLAIVVRSDLPVKNTQELIKLAKEKPGTLTFGSAGYGSSQHMVGEKFQQATGIKLLHVPYKGSGPALTDLMGGQVDMVFETMPTLMGQVNNPKLRFIAVTTKERAPTLPDVPTLAEEGVKGVDLSTRYAVLAPKGTPPDVLKTLSDAMVKSAASESLQRAALKQGVAAVPSTPEETDKALVAEVSIWSEVVDKANLR